MSEIEPKNPSAMLRRVSLRPGGHLDRYVAKLFAASFAVAFLLVVGLFLIIDLSSNLEDYLRPDEFGEAPSGWLVVRYYVLNLPFLYLQVAPFVTMVAGLFTAARLVRSNEVVAALNAGVSGQRMLASVLACGFVLGGGMFVLRELATESIGRERQRVQDLLIFGEERSYLQEFTFIDRSDNLVEVSRFFPGESDGTGARIESLVGTPVAVDATSRVHANGLEYRVDAQGQGSWHIDHAERHIEDEGGRRVEPLEDLAGLDFTPRDILVSHKAEEVPLELSFGETLAMTSRDPDNVQYQTLLQYHLTFPLANLVLLLVGLPFLLRHERGGKLEKVGEGFLLCLFYYGADFISRSLGMQGQLTPVMASWLPVVFFGSLGIVLFGSMRT